MSFRLATGWPNTVPSISAIEPGFRLSTFTPKSGAPVGPPCWMGPPPPRPVAGASSLFSATYTRPVTASARAAAGKEMRTRIPAGSADSASKGDSDEQQNGDD